MNKKTTIIILSIIILVGAWLRMHNFHDWLYFKWDQARDATLLAPAIQNGPAELPLLGPRAIHLSNGDYLRLGPAYYYTQYLAGTMFNSVEPAVFAYADLFFGILTIPLFYFFLRLYFNRNYSLLGAAFYALAFLPIQYSRFSWNPNAVPFFAILCFYALLQSLDSPKSKKQIGWLALSALSYSIASQYHFFAFFVLTVVLAIFLAIRFWPNKQKRKKIFAKKTFAFIFTIVTVIAITYTPVIVSDTKTNFSNTKNFFLALGDKPRDDKTTAEKIIRNFREQAKGYFLIASSFQHRGGQKADPIPVSFGLLLIGSGIGFACYLKKRKSENQKKDFLLLLAIWIGAFFLITIPTSYQLRPRYFTVIFPIPFIIILLWLQMFKIFLSKKNYLPVIILGSSLILTCNAYGVKGWFWEQEQSQKKSFDTRRTLILKKQDGVTLGQLERAVDHALQVNQGKDTLFYHAKEEYRSPLKYLFKLRNPNIELIRIKKTKDLLGKEKIIVFNTASGGFDSVPKYIKDFTTVQNSTQFGQYAVFELAINHAALLENQNTKDLTDNGKKVEDEKRGDKAPDKKEDNQKKGKTERLFWKDVL